MEENLELAVVHVLNEQVPEEWKQFAYGELTQSERDALKLLGGAGLVERRIPMQVHFVDREETVEWQIIVTGERGLEVAVRQVAEKFAELAGGTDHAPSFIGLQRQEWRLTPEGLSAKTHRSEFDRKHLIDFVVHRVARNVTARKPEIVEGWGFVESFRVSEPNRPRPQEVHVTNFEDLIALLREGGMELSVQTEEDTEGPVAPDGWRSKTNGVIYCGMPPTAWRLVNALWGAKDRKRTIDDLQEPVFGDRNEGTDVPTLRNHAAAATRFFKAKRLPWRVRVSAAVNMVPEAALMNKD